MRSPDIKLSARSWSVCPPTSILLVSASVAPHAKSLQCHELTERALHEERGNAFYPRLAIAASPLADGKHPRKNWPRRTSFSRIYRSRKLSLASITKKSWLAPNPPCIQEWGIFCPWGEREEASTTREPPACLLLSPRRDGRGRPISVSVILLFGS